MRFLLWLLLPGLVLAGAVSASAAAEETPQRQRLEARRLATPPVIDGQLAEDEWEGAALLTGFTQLVPEEGEPATEKTEVHVGYDEENLYFGVRAYDSEPDKLVANIMTRDGEITYDDTVTIILDTFRDRQSGFLFTTSPLGVKVDALVRKEGEEVNLAWDGEWSCAASRDAAGYVAEIAIPFKTLRFAAAEEQVWGFNVSRSIARKREEVFWQPMTKDYGFYAAYTVSHFGELAGLRGIRQGRRYDLKPYLSVGKEEPHSPSRDEEEILEAGLDLKIHLTSNLVVDLTLNTDFAEAEADVQVVNLTRFPLFFPEKRGFFLEGASLFYFGDRPEPYRLADNFFFFSRRIGLTADGSQKIPVLGGVKLTGEVGKLGLGVLHLRTDEEELPGPGGTTFVEPETDFTVIRLRRAVLEKSSIGLLALNKDPGTGSNRLVGADWDFALSDGLATGGYVIKSTTPDFEDWAGSADVNWDSRKTRVRVAYTEIGKNFNDEMGFVPRLGIRKFRGDFNYNIWPEESRVRIAWLTYDIDYITDTDGELESRVQTVQANGFFQSSAGLSFKYFDNLEVLKVPFRIHRDVTIPPGSYSFDNFFFGFQTDYSRRAGGAGRFAAGDFYDGEFVQLFGSFVLRAVEGLLWFTHYQWTEVRLPAGDFIAELFEVELSYAKSSPDVSAVALYQWNREDNSFLRLVFKWVYRPESAVFVVYEDQRDLTGSLDPFRPSIGIPGRSLLVKTVFAF